MGDIKKQLAWAHVAAHKETLEAIDNEKQAVVAAIPELEAGLENVQAELGALETRKGEVFNFISDTTQQLEPLQTAVSETNKKLEHQRSVIRRLQSNSKSANRDLSELVRVQEGLEKQVKELTEQIYKESQAQLSQYDSTINKIQGRLSDAKRKFSEVEGELEEANEQVKKARNDENVAKADAKTTEMHVRGLETEIKRLREAKNNADKNFGGWVPQLKHATLLMAILF